MGIDSDHILGMLSAALRQPDQAATHIEAALARWGEGPYPEYAWTAYHYAVGLLDRSDESSQEKAKQLLGQSLDISAELGMQPLMERVRSRREILGA